MKRRCLLVLCALTIYEGYSPNANGGLGNKESVHSLTNDIVWMSKLRSSTVLVKPSIGRVSVCPQWPSFNKTWEVRSSDQTRSLLHNHSRELVNILTQKNSIRTTFFCSLPNDANDFTPHLCLRLAAMPVTTYKYNRWQRALIAATPSDPGQAQGAKIWRLIFN